MKIKKGDKVKVISGKYKGRESVVERSDPKKRSLIVENINMVTKHMKPSGKNKGGIIKIARPIQVSNVMLVCPKCSKPVRVGYKTVDGKKLRLCKSCSEVIK